MELIIVMCVGVEYSVRLHPLLRHLQFYPKEEKQWRQLCVLADRVQAPKVISGGRGEEIAQMTA